MPGTDPNIFPTLVPTRPSGTDPEGEHVEVIVAAVMPGPDPSISPTLVPTESSGTDPEGGIISVVIVGTTHCS